MLQAARSMTTVKGATGPILILALAAVWFASSRIDWASNPPGTPLVPMAAWIGAAMDWLTRDARLGSVTVRDITRALAWVMDWPLSAANAVLWKGVSFTGGWKVMPISWVGIVSAMTLLGHAMGGLRLAALNFVSFLYLALFGLWESAMMTFASILVAVPLSCLTGFFLAVAIFGNRRLEAATLVVMNFMQTVPIFAYLLPILFLFGFSPVSAMLGTMIYAMPAMVRTTLLAFNTTSEELVELGRIVGATRHQMVWKILVPAARPLLTVGVNQVIVLSLNAVIIASIIGAGGLGFDVLKALRTLDTGRGLEAGVAIVLMAVCLDQISIAYARRSGQERAGLRFRNRYLVLGVAIIVLATALSYVWPFARALPAGYHLSVAPHVREAVDYITISFGDGIDAVTGLLYIHVLNPFRDFLVGLPWLFVIFGLSLAGRALGGVRLSLLVLSLLAFILLTGFWRASMNTVYLIGIAVTLSLLLGVPLGIAGALNDRVSAVLNAVCNTLQTLPSFVYLVPVVMLFRVGDVPAIIAVVLYAVTPAIRYTDMGIRRVDPDLIEGAKAMGTTPLQKLLLIRLPMAVPEILLGVNQTIMLAISMLVITALVGTQDLGQEVYIGLSRADTGRGLVAGICVAFVSIIADRLIQAYASGRKQALGLQ